MDAIVWTQDFAVGIEEVDSQHRALIDMINALAVGLDPAQATSATRDILDQLSDYVRVHFRLEERLMAQGGCDAEFEHRHRGEHAYFRGVLKDFSSDFASGRSRVTASFIDYLVHWLLHHIVVTDREMVAHLNSANPGHDLDAAARMVQNMADELGASERHLLHELQVSHAELEQRLAACLDELRDTRAQLEEARRRLGGQGS